MTTDLSRRRVLGSASWATAQQAVMLGSAAVTGIILARTLSIQHFGVFSYAIALAGIGTAILTGGLNALAIKALVDDPERQDRTMSALVLIRESLALTAYLLLVGFAAITGEALTTTVTAIALIALFARGIDATELYFQSRVESRKSASVRIGVVLVLLALRIGAAVLGLGLVVFVVLYVAEAVATSIGLLARYLTSAGTPGFGLVDLARARELLGQSWLLLLSGTFAFINLRADLVLIQLMMGSAFVGTYAAAARLSELPYFLPVVFMTATFPALLAVRRRAGSDSPQYQRALQRSYDQACWIGIGIAAVLWAIGPWLITTLYGARYSAAGQILQIHVLVLPFVFMAAVFSKWIIAEGFLVASLLRHLLGASVNVGLNLLLIPGMGLTGAAVATVCSYAIASYFSTFIGHKTRPAGVQMTRALLAPGFIVARRLTHPSGSAPPPTPLPPTRDRDPAPRLVSSDQPTRDQRVSEPTL